MRKSFVLLMLAVLLPACGQKGPLYLAPPKPAAGIPTAAPPAAARTDDEKTPVPPDAKSP